MTKTAISSLLLALLIGMATIGGCSSSEGKELVQIEVGLSWVHESQFAGVYWADQNGFYEDEGITVNLTPYQFEDLGQTLVDGKYDFVFMQADTLLQARAAGLPVKAVFADYRLMPTCYFSKKEKNITRPEDLIGKKVGVAYSERYPLIGMLKNIGVDSSEVEIIDREYNYDALADDTFDVEAGWVTDGDLVQQAVGEYNIMHPFDYGVNWYADLITTTEDMIENRSELVERFVRATAKGWQGAIENLDEAALLTQRYDPAMDADHLKFVLRHSSPLIHTGEARIGWMRESVWKTTHDMLLEQGVLDHPIDYSQCYTLEFLD